MPPAARPRPVAPVAHPFPSRTSRGTNTDAPRSTCLRRHGSLTRIPEKMDDNSCSNFPKHGVGHQFEFSSIFGGGSDFLPFNSTFLRRFVSLWPICTAGAASVPLSLSAQDSLPKLGFAVRGLGQLRRRGLGGHGGNLYRIPSYQSQGNR